ncbi:MAG: hypothetical protein U1E05_00690 [Patescibacteria group bacterium]|nr:hypothetical protein [Patescibacteria group bacterium]
MQWTIGDPPSAVRGAFASVIGWTLLIAGGVLVGFLIGYWVGHGEITAAGRTCEAFMWLPVVWLGRPMVLIAFLATGLAWYLPLRYESTWLRVTAATANLLTWIVVIAVEVERCSQGKLWRW